MINKQLLIIDEFLARFAVGKIVNEKGSTIKFDKSIALKLLREAGKVQQDSFESEEKIPFKKFFKEALEEKRNEVFLWFEKELNTLQKGDRFSKEAGFEEFLNKNPFLDEESAYNWYEWFNKYMYNYGLLLWFKNEVEKQKNLSTDAEATLEHLIIEYENLGVEYLFARYKAILEWRNYSKRKGDRNEKYIK